MDPVKRFLNSEFVLQALYVIAAGYIRFVYKTSRWTVIGGDIPKQFWDEDRPFILSFWHGRMMLMPRIWNREKPINALVSMHRDGRLISGVFDQFNIKTVPGSTSRGGSSALRTLIRALKSGESIGITPDGPRGPRMRATDGIVTLARMTNVPIIPATFSFRRRKVLGSWDRFIVAFPFSRAALVWGEPIIVPHTAKKGALETSRLEIEQAMTSICDTADKLCGHAPIEAATIETGDGTP